jgi:hypothetical protein
MAARLITLFFGGGTDSRERRRAGYIGASVGLAIFGLLAEFCFRRAASRIMIVIVALFCGHTLGWLTGVVLHDRLMR